MPNSCVDGDGKAGASESAVWSASVARGVAGSTSALISVLGDVADRVLARLRGVLR
jgi:hypothetical protein